MDSTISATTRSEKARRAALARHSRLTPEERSAEAKARRRKQQLTRPGPIKTKKLHGPPGPCRYCAELLDSMRSKNRVCRSGECRRRHNADRMRPYMRTWSKTDQGRASKQRRNARRRARLSGVERQEYDRRDIFRRDGWVCQLCGGVVDPSLVGPDPMSATIDHVIPLSLDGPDCPENVQLAHYRCNSSKADRAR